MNKDKNYNILSLGQGQEQTADRFIQNGRENGRWVVLQNCHLSLKYVNKIESMLDSECHPDFRLWLTTMPCQNFPVAIL